MDKLDCIILGTWYALVHNMFLNVHIVNHIAFSPHYGNEVLIQAVLFWQCFLNAIVQCLSHTQGLRDYCLTKAYLQDMCSSQEPVLTNGGRIVPCMHIRSKKKKAVEALHSLICYESYH